jgi:hypothetical protein
MNLTRRFFLLLFSVFGFVFSRLWARQERAGSWLAGNLIESRAVPLIPQSYWIDVPRTAARCGQEFGAGEGRGL